MEHRDGSTTSRVAPAPQGALPARDPRRAARRVLPRQRDAGPGVIKVVVNMGVGEAARDAQAHRRRAARPTAITGQKPQSVGRPKSIAQFKLREGQPIGAAAPVAADPAEDHLGPLPDWLRGRLDEEDVCEAMFAGAADQQVVALRFTAADLIAFPAGAAAALTAVQAAGHVRRLFHVVAGPLDLDAPVGGDALAIGLLVFVAGDVQRGAAGPGRAAGRGLGAEGRHRAAGVPAHRPRSRHPAAPPRPPGGPGGSRRQPAVLAEHQPRAPRRTRRRAARPRAQPGRARAPRPGVPPAALAQGRQRQHRARRDGPPRPPGRAPARGAARGAPAPRRPGHQRAVRHQGRAAVLRRPRRARRPERAGRGRPGRDHRRAPGRPGRGRHRAARVAAGRGRTGRGARRRPGSGAVEGAPAARAPEPARRPAPGHDPRQPRQARHGGLLAPDPRRARARPARPAAAAGAAGVERGARGPRCGAGLRPGQGLGAGRAARGSRRRARRARRAGGRTGGGRGGAGRGRPGEGQGGRARRRGDGHRARRDRAPRPPAQHHRRAGHHQGAAHPADRQHGAPARRRRRAHARAPGRPPGRRRADRAPEQRHRRAAPRPGRGAPHPRHHPRAAPPHQRHAAQRDAGAHGADRPALPALPPPGARPLQGEQPRRQAGHRRREHRTRQEAHRRDRRPAHPPHPQRHGPRPGDPRRPRQVPANRARARSNSKPSTRAA